MEVELNELIDILSSEHKVFEEYLHLLTEQQEHLIQNNLAGIKSNIEKINMLAEEAANLENGRRRLMGRISESMRLKPSDISLSRLLERVNSPNLKEMERLKDTILEVHDKISYQKTRNELLIEQSLRIINQTMQFIHEVNNPRATYDNPLKSGGFAHQSALVSRMI